MGFVASAPCKAILFGEHYVVYGAPALALAIEPRNRVLFSKREGKGIALRSELGNGLILASGKYEGAGELGIFSEVAAAVFGKAPLPSCTAEFKPAWKLKGVGTSASLCAAFAAGLFKLAGKKATQDEMFAAAQSGDFIAHGGRASGIDAKTVTFGCPLVFQRSFSPPAFNSSPSGFSLPPGCSFLLIDTNRGKKGSTLKMLEEFALQFGITGTPVEANEEQKRKICWEYAPLWEKIEKKLPGASAKELGAMMNENHALLKKRKMSSRGIESAVSSSLAAGAYGAKLTGGGGEGGAVLVLCSNKERDRVASSVFASTSFECHPISVAKKGAAAD